MKHARATILKRMEYIQTSPDCRVLQESELVTYLGIHGVTKIQCPSFYIPTLMSEKSKKAYEPFL